jgi:transposase
MEKIGSSDLYQRFSRDLIRKLDPEASLMYDITSIPSYSIAPVFEYGHAKDQQDLEQINFSMFMEKRRSVPLYYELYPGSIPDIVTLKRTIEYLSPFIREMEIILDRDFFTLENLRLISKMKYIIAASLARKEIKGIFSGTTRTVDRVDNVMMYEGDPIFCQKVSFQIQDLDLTGYFYHDPKRETEKRSDFHRKLREKREQIENLQIRRGLRKTIEGIAGSYGRYISYSTEDGRIITKAKDNAISSAENRMGRFLLVYRGGYSASDCLTLYRQRDVIEKAFRVLKTDLDLFPLRDHKESTIRGTMFVFFLSLIIRSALHRGMQSSHLDKKYSIETMILKLERTTKKKEILDILERILLW